MCRNNADLLKEGPKMVVKRAFERRTRQHQEWIETWCNKACVDYVRAECADQGDHGAKQRS